LNWIVKLKFKSELESLRTEEISFVLFVNRNWQAGRTPQSPSFSSVIMALHVLAEEEDDAVVEAMAIGSEASTQEIALDDKLRLAIT
jgi:hypothetical protein